MKNGRGGVYRLAKFKVNSAKHFLMKSERVEMFQYIVDTLDYENIECWENKKIMFLNTSKELSGVRLK